MLLFYLLIYWGLFRLFQEGTVAKIDLELTTLLQEARLATHLAYVFCVLNATFLLKENHISLELTQNYFPALST